VEAIVERFRAMEEDLAKERTMMMKQWAKREVQIRGVIDSTVGMYGDLQGIAGSALGEIEYLEIPCLKRMVRCGLNNNRGACEIFTG
jgi:hypothetical protein